MTVKVGYVKISLMKRGWLIAIAIVFVLVLVGLIVRAKFFSKPGLGALQISTTPKATVYLDGNQTGITPFFEEDIAIGEHTVRLEPEATENDLAPWEGKIEVSSNILTVINRELASDEASSSGEVLTLEKIGSKNSSSLAVVSIPDQAVVKIDGQPKGFAPVQVEDLAPGSYEVVISSTGYRERVVSANTVAGYKLTISVKLAKEIEGFEEEEPEEAEEEEEEPKEEETPTPTPSPKGSPKPTPTPPEKPYVKVKETPTGWLRVREEPSTGSSEVAKIAPDEMYPYSEEEKNGWYKIEYEDGKEGWVSGVYVELVE